MLLQVFWGSLIVGGLLIAASILLGDAESHLDHDLDLDADADVDVDHDMDKEIHLELDGETAAWLPFLSLRFWTFGLATFGAVGTLIDLASRPWLGMTAPSSAVTVGVAATMGVLIGWLTAWGFRKLKRASVTGDVGLRQIKGSEATILLAVSGSKRGKIRALVGGQAVDLLACSLDEGLLERGEKVLVVEVDDGTAMVTRLRQLTRSDP